MLRGTHVLSWSGNKDLINLGSVVSRALDSCRFLYGASYMALLL